MFVRNAACMQRPAAGGSFDPNLNLLPDPGFDDAGIGAFSGTNVNTDTPSALRLTGRNGTYTVAASGLLIPGTYHFTANLVSYQNANSFVEPVKVTVAGTSANTASLAHGVIAIQLDIVVSVAANQNIVIGGLNTSFRDFWDMTDAVLKQTA